MGLNVSVTRQFQSLQCPKSFLAWQPLANFSSSAESLSTFPLNVSLTLPYLPFLGLWQLQPGRRSWNGLTVSHPCCGSIGLLQTRRSVFSDAWCFMDRLGWPYWTGTLFKCAVVLMMELPFGLLAITLLPFINCTFNQRFIVFSEKSIFEVFCCFMMWRQNYCFQNLKETNFFACYGNFLVIFW